MARIIDDLLALVAATPLPAIEEGELSTPNDTAPYVRPKTRSQTRAPRPSLKIRLPVPAAHVVKKSHSKKRKPNFTIFTDDDTTSDVSSAISTPKRSRTSTPRTPLSERIYSTNSTPAPSPRHPSTPFSLSPLDPYWENLENYAPFTVPATPPTTPPTVSHPSRLPPPPNTLLYTLLGLTSWRATPSTIKKSYRRMARTLHPDKASSEEERVKANAAMQRLNAARDVLVDAEKREEYHRTGVVDWVG
ncbi:hypothetical protein COCVIDRAFT_17624 [Bipolaris victoriae FI3]|uniref:J domain-containing protein n=1 Tax=Bipolaris victoriae (strain FI3) TaxID=930091 RepID=W7E3Y3_BIPV3|nr:hypothetical protein COCVIDRAFT_17624 [Bipolaris victoriae FI3]